MEYDDYKASVTQKIRALSQEEYNMISSLAQQPVAEIIFSVLGEDLTRTIVAAMTPPEAQPTPAAPADLPAQMQQAGLA